jgi:hypothetical protein
MQSYTVWITDDGRTGVLWALGRYTLAGDMA